MTRTVRTSGSFACFAFMAVTVAWGRPAAGAEIEWSTDVQKTWRQAAARQQPMLIFATMQGCGYCDQMHRDTFRDRRVVSQINTLFRPVVIRAEQQARLLRQLRITAFPTTLVVSPDGQVIARLDDYLPPREIERRLQDILRDVQAAEAVHAQR